MGSLQWGNFSHVLVYYCLHIIHINISYIYLHLSLCNNFCIKDLTGVSNGHYIMKVSVPLCLEEQLEQLIKFFYLSDAKKQPNHTRMTMIRFTR